jgi:hypothetical protein
MPLILDTRGHSYKCHMPGFARRLLTEAPVNGSTGDWLRAPRSVALLIAAFVTFLVLVTSCRVSDDSAADAADGFLSCKTKATRCIKPLCT